MQAVDIIELGTKPLQTPTCIEQLWNCYQQAAAEKQRVYVVRKTATDRDIDAAEAACNQAYDALADLADAILNARPAASADLAIKAEIIARREADLGGACEPHEITAFCRDVQIMAGVQL